MEYYFTKGRIFVRGNIKARKKGKKADYILYTAENYPIAVIEAKDNNHTAAHGIQQAIDYAEILDIPFAYSSNGDGFVEHDFLTSQERNLTMGEFPKPKELIERWKKYKDYTPEQQKIIDQPFYSDPYSYEPRYYQAIAVNKTIEAIARGENRVLIVMATGTGKTITAFQIIHRLRASGLKKKILYLADRNILIDQTMVQDFKPFKKVMTKVQGASIDSAYEVYMALYHQLVASEDGKEDPFTQVQPSFFDLIIVDECHRGSAKGRFCMAKSIGIFLFSHTDRYDCNSKSRRGGKQPRLFW
jgi:type I restriction enzyme R subunit